MKHVSNGKEGVRGGSLSSMVLRECRPLQVRGALRGRLSAGIGVTFSELAWTRAFPLERLDFPMECFSDHEP
jgi:hypothetical protein